LRRSVKPKVSYPGLQTRIYIKIENVHTHSQNIIAKSPNKLMHGRYMFGDIH